MERDSRNTTDEREHGHQGCHGSIEDSRVAYETNSRAGIITLRAGKPELIVPFGHDQFDNANRVNGSERARGTGVPNVTECYEMLTFAGALVRLPPCRGRLESSGPVKAHRFISMMRLPHRRRRNASKPVCPPSRESPGAGR